VKRRIKNVPPFIMFTKLVDKNAIKPEKGVPSPKFSQTLPLKIWRKLHGPPPGF
jgi:hypothetical protein